MPVTDDPRAQLVQLVVRLRAETEVERAAAVEQLLPLLRENGVALAVRIGAAARAIESLPDTAESIRPVVQALTAGLTPAPALQRLRQLQHLVEKCAALDAMVDAREPKVKLDCPHCGARLPRAEMVKHLWHEHRLSLAGGKTRSRARTVGAIRGEFAALGDPALFDRAAEVGGEQAVGVWAAETASAEESLPVCSAARERGASVCPGCFADVPPAVLELPPPLVVAHGRIAGDGHSAAVRGTNPPRVPATVAAVVVLLTLPLLAALTRGPLSLVAACVFALAGFAYLVTFLVLWPRRAPDEAAINAAWRKLAPRLADKGSATRFLTRLCLTSFGRGDPMERAQVLNRIIARARDDPDERQLLAVALALRVDDGGRYGRDTVAGIADLVGRAFDGEQPADFAAFALGAYLRVARESGERGRLRVLLYDAAFAAGLTIRDVIALGEASPPIAEAMGLPHHHIALLYGVWVNRDQRPWDTISAAQTVFELATTAPTSAGELLTEEPGLLLVCPTDPEVEEELGPLLITVAGVALGGLTVTDPDVEVSVEGAGRELIFGKHALKLRASISDDFAAEVKAWMRFRADVFADYPSAYLSDSTAPDAHLLTPFVVTCLACRTNCVPVVGEVARPRRA